MCGRYTLKTPASELQQEFSLPEPLTTEPARYNIAPSQPVPIVLDGNPPRLERVRWGLIPFWAKDEKVGYKMINARSETLTQKPAYREAVQKRRCLVPADGFFEWRAGPQGRIPMYIRRRGGLPFAFAGLYDTWRPKDRAPIRSCTIVTTAANPLVAPVHDRMPVILTRSQYARWLGPGELSEAELEQLLKPHPAEEMEAFEVSTLVNSPKNDLPACIEPMH
jgi:putative SOS response-associated peptidase YedK